MDAPADGEHQHRQPKVIYRPPNKLVTEDWYPIAPIVQLPAYVVLFPSIVFSLASQRGQIRAKRANACSLGYRVDGVIWI